MPIGHLVPLRVQVIDKPHEHCKLLNRFFIIYYVFSAIFETEKKYEGPRLRPPIFSLPRTKLSSSDDETQCLRSDHIHVLVLDDQQDSEEIRADCDECLATHG